MVESELKLARSTPFKSLGRHLRHIRTQEGVSLTLAAERVGLLPSTLSLWESDKRKPSGTALDPLLKSYSIASRYYAYILAYADPLYAKTALADYPFGPAIDIGQLLRGLRIRTKLTQKGLADKAGVTQGAIAKWENGENLPTGSSLHSLLYALEASSQEVEHILTSEFADPGRDEEMPNMIRLLRANFVTDPIVDVSLMRLERDLWEGAARDPETDRALISTMSRRAWAYFDRLRLEEAEEVGLRALKAARRFGLWEAATDAFQALNRSRWLRFGNLQETIARERAYVERLRNPYTILYARSSFAALETRNLNAGALDHTRAYLDGIHRFDKDHWGIDAHLHIPSAYLYHAQALLNHGDGEGCIEMLLKANGGEMRRVINGDSVVFLMRALLRIGQEPTCEMKIAAELHRENNAMPLSRMYWAVYDREASYYRRGREASLDPNVVGVDWRKFRGSDGNLYWKHFTDAFNG